MSNENEAIEQEPSHAVAGQVNAPVMRRVECCDCEWRGNESEQKQVKSNCFDSIGVKSTVSVCPNCGHDEFYQLSTIKDLAKNSDAVSAVLSIELNITCPHCDEYFDLIEHENMNEEGAMINAACPNGHWSDEHPKFKESGINCPQCHKEFNVEGIQW